MADQAIWQKEGAGKRSAVQGMFAEIAPTYDCLNSVMSFRLHHRWRAYAVSLLKLREGDRVLDVCCGTGDFMSPLERIVGRGRVFGVDFCRPMLEVAQRKGHVEVALADACVLPIQSNHFDGVSVGWGIRNVPDVDAAHRELFRILKPGGRFVSLDMARPRNPLIRIPSEIAARTILPALGSMFGRTKAYTYLPKSTQTFKSRSELKASMADAGFVDVGYRDLFFGNICVHWGAKP